MLIYRGTLEVIDSEDEGSDAEGCDLVLNSQLSRELDGLCAQHCQCQCRQPQNQVVAVAVAVLERKNGQAQQRTGSARPSVSLLT